MNSIIITWAITLGSIAFVILLVILRNRRKDKMFAAEISVFAAENNSILTHKDQWQNSQIGLEDTEAPKLFFIRRTPVENIKRIIYLSDIEHCRLVKSIRTEKIGKDRVTVIDRLLLVFSPLDEKAEFSLEFYNTDYNALTLSGELQIAEKWTDLINRIIRSNRKPEAVKDIIHDPSWYKKSGRKQNKKPIHAHK